MITPYFILVWGPPASGKSLNRAALRQHFQCDTVIDDPDPAGFQIGAQRFGRVLVLANTRELSFERKGLPREKFEPQEEYRIGSMKVLLGDQWVEPRRDEAGISDESFAEIERLTLTNMEELVVAKAHCEDDEFEDALNCIKQVEFNCARLRELVPGGGVKG